MKFEIGHTCNSWNVVSDEIEFIGKCKSQKCECRCGKRQLVACYRLNPKNKYAATGCVDCNKRNDYNHLNKDLLEEEYYKNNMSIKNISEKYNCNKNTIEKKLNKFNIKLRKSKKRKISPEIDIHKLSGLNIGSWEVQDKIIVNLNNCNYVKYKCKCACGNSCIIDYYSILNSKNGCKYCFGDKISGSKSSRWKGYEDLSGSLFGSYKTNAMKRNLDFDIDLKYLWNLFVGQEKNCALSGCEITLDQTNCKVKQTASLDRIDCNFGYLKGNVQWVHKKINKMKLNLQQVDFIELCKNITRYKKLNKDICKIEKRNIKFNFYFKQILNSANLRNIDFNLNCSELENLFYEQQGLCHYSGFVLKIKDNIKNTDWNASIDRVNSNYGYSLNNICWCDKRINQMKWDMTKEEFFNWCQKVANKWIKT